MSSSELNELGLPVGLPVEGEYPRPRPPHSLLQGQYGDLVPLAPQHAEGLFDAMALDRDGRGWTYMPIGPWQSLEDAKTWVTQHAALEDPLFYVVRDTHGRPLGFCSYLRITPAVGTIEVGWIRYSPALQRTRLATEAMYLMMRHVFEDLGYRRYEWKCDALNAPSKAAAERLGFTYEGTFRQATITKGRNRDTAWFSILDSEWPALKARLENWLAPTNFTSDGQQKRRLQDI
ncbi:GNAT family N-acetyltransferase [Primorskyibacter sp. 2E233]|uniref:GNAT family N-acetyltransferase n=1 Tax=Primorskyibacter sp. 2E233 TaxID=3413431 RepID=UPI003BF24C6F